MRTFYKRKLYEALGKKRKTKKRKTNAQFFAALEATAAELMIKAGSQRVDKELFETSIVALANP